MIRLAALRGSAATAAPELSAALRPWAQRLMLESLWRWLLRGALAALAVACLVLSIGWFVPWPMSDLMPIAVQAGAPLLVAGAIVGLWPASRLRRAAQLDTRLQFADRLATAWLERAQTVPMARLQRSEALVQLALRSPARDLPLRWPRLEGGALLVLGLLALVLAFGPTPMRGVLQQQAADAAAVQQASDRVEALRQAVVADNHLSADEAQRLDELLQQARADLARAKSQQEAQTILASTAQQLTQMGDPAADAQEEALGAMSETLAQEPLTRELSDALQGNDASATRQAVQNLAEAARADQLSDVQRQALSRALQRAANVGRGEPRSAAALREAARALASGEPTDPALGATSEALQQALQALTDQATLRSTSQRLQDLRMAMASGMPLEQEQSLPSGLGSASEQAVLPEPGRSLPIDSAATRRPDVSGEPANGAGAGAASAANPGSAPGAAGQANENVFVPGTPSGGPADRDAIQQPFTVRGQAHPYRDVLSQYAQAGRDYVDRASVAPNVRELVKQYFSKLEEGQ